MTTVKLINGTVIKFYELDEYVWYYELLYCNRVYGGGPYHEEVVAEKAFKELADLESERTGYRYTEVLSLDRKHWMIDIWKADSEYEVIYTEQLLPYKGFSTIDETLEVFVTAYNCHANWLKDGLDKF